MASSDTELLTEHFGYPPVSLLDDIINSVNILAERALNSVEQALLRQPPASLGFRPAKKTKPEERAAAEAAAAEALQLEVENGTHQLETLLCASIDRNFDKFEIYVMRNILCVPAEDRDWIRLANYEGLDFAAVDPADDEDEDADADANVNGRGRPPSDAALARMHRRLQASLRLGTLLEAETARHDVLLARVRALVGDVKAEGSVAKSETDADTDTDTRRASGASPASASAASALGFLLDRGPLTESDRTTPLTTTTAFALSQLPALRQLSGRLREMAPGLAAATTTTTHGKTDDADDTDKSWRRERLEYVEGATRKHLERRRGLGLGPDGEVVRSADGTTAEDGSASADLAVEPEALTNILSILRGGAAPTTAAPSQPDGDAMDES